MDSYEQEGDPCPRCGKPISTAGGHGGWCLDPACKWGWEVELDGSPLQPPTDQIMFDMIRYKFLYNAGH
jgi:hypothetical protein